MTFSVAYMQQAMVQQSRTGQRCWWRCSMPATIRALPATAQPGCAESKGSIETALKDVPSLDDDRIIRRFKNVIDAVLRTNFFQKDPMAPRARPWR